jgi:hypothetical protein
MKTKLIIKELLEAVTWEPLENAKNYTFCAIKYTDKLVPEEFKVAFCQVEYVGDVFHFFTLEGKHYNYNDYLIHAIGVLK